jgi:NDP-sugar pyrophosphorylase family protein
VEGKVEAAVNRTPFVFTESTYSLAAARQAFLKSWYKLIPIVDEGRRVVAYVRWDEVLSAEDGAEKKRASLDVPVVIMAGGKGTRLAPFTNVLPKPLIPIGDRTILEHIIDRFLQFGIREFYLTLNYRGEMVKAYLDSTPRSYKLNYIWEKEYLGTAGSLRQLSGMINGTFIVSNCDILVKAEYDDVVDFHTTNGSMLTVVSSIQHHTIPYGVVEFVNGGVVTAIKEKPEFSFPINTGVYVLDSGSLKHIPPDGAFNMTDLICALIADRRKVLTYPVNEKDYLDIGQWEEYQKALLLLNSGDESAGFPRPG